jgi:hypothetical protein
LKLLPSRVTPKMKKEHEEVMRSLQSAWSGIDTANKDTALCVFAGAVAFGSTLALSTLTQWRILLISTGTPSPTPSLVGIASVCAASWASHQAALFTRHCIDQRRLEGSSQQYNSQTLSSWWSSWREKERRAILSYERGNKDDYLDVKYFRIPWHTVHM